MLTGQGKAGFCSCSFLRQRLSGRTFQLPSGGGEVSQGRSGCSCPGLFSALPSPSAGLVTQSKALPICMQETQQSSSSHHPCPHGNMRCRRAVGNRGGSSGKQWEAVGKQWGQQWEAVGASVRGAVVASVGAVVGAAVWVAGMTEPCPNPRRGAVCSEEPSTPQGCRAGG